MKSKRPHRQRRVKPNDAGFPSVNDIEKALKLARRCDPVLAEMMEAKNSDDLRTSTR